MGIQTLGKSGSLPIVLTDAGEKTLNLPAGTYSVESNYGAVVGGVDVFPGKDVITFTTSITSAVLPKALEVVPSESAAFSPSPYAMTYGNSLYVAAGENLFLATSTDGITWTTRNFGTSSSSLLTANYLNNIFIVAGTQGILATSTDGITWATRTSGFGTTAIRSVSYGNGVYLAVGDSNSARVSTDAITWTTSAISSNYSTLQTAEFDGTRFIVSGYLSNNYHIRNVISTDGGTWDYTTNKLGSITKYKNGKYLSVTASFNSPAVRNRILWATSIEKFNSAKSMAPSLSGSIISSSSVKGFEYGDGTYFAWENSDSGVIHTSTDGATWKYQQLPISAVFDLVYANNKLLAVTADGAVSIALSTTGSNVVLTKLD